MFLITKFIFVDTVGVEPKQSDCKSVGLPLSSDPFIRLSESSTIAVSVVHHSYQFPITRDLTVGVLVARRGIEPRFHP